LAEKSLDRKPAPIEMMLSVKAFLQPIFYFFNVRTGLTRSTALAQLIEPLVHANLP